MNVIYKTRNSNQFSKNENEEKTVCQLNYPKINKNTIVEVTLCLVAMLLNIVSSEKAEIIKLMNATNIICAAKEITNSAIFIHPPLPEVSDSTNLLETNWWKDDNWNNNSPEDLYYESVLDRRWEDFSLNFTNNMIFLNFTSTTLFIYGAVEVRFLSSDEDYSYSFKINIEEDNQWTALGFFVKNQNVYIFESNKLIHTFEEVGNMEMLLITTDKETYFKVAKYPFIESTVSSRKKTSLTIPKNQRTYLILYVSLCSWCKLEISSNEKNATIKSIAEDNEILRKWQIYKLDIDLTKDVTLEFNRIVTGNQTDGYWSLDIKLYRNKLHITTYKYNESHLYPDQPKCDFLLNDTLKNVNTVTLKNCKPGELGTKCAIHCNDIFGNASTLNNGYKPCENITYNNELNYAEMIKENLSFTEKPKDNKVWITFDNLFLIIVVVLPYVLLCVVVMYFLIKNYRKCYSSGKENNNSEENCCLKENKNGNKTWV